MYKKKEDKFFHILVFYLFYSILRELVFLTKYLLYLTTYTIYLHNNAAISNSAYRFVLRL